VARPQLPRVQPAAAEGLLFARVTPRCAGHGLGAGAASKALPESPTEPHRCSALIYREPSTRRSTPGRYLTPRAANNPQRSLLGPLHTREMKNGEKALFLLRYYFTGTRTTSGPKGREARTQAPPPPSRPSSVPGSRAGLSKAAFWLRAPAPSLVPLLNKGSRQPYSITRFCPLQTVPSCHTDLYASAGEPDPLLQNL